MGPFRYAAKRASIRRFDDSVSCLGRMVTCLKEAPAAGAHLIVVLGSQQQIAWRIPTGIEQGLHLSFIYGIDDTLANCLHKIPQS